LYKKSLKVPVTTDLVCSWKAWWCITWTFGWTSISICRDIWSTQ